MECLSAAVSTVFAEFCTMEILLHVNATRITLHMKVELKGNPFCIETHGYETELHIKKWDCTFLNSSTCMEAICFHFHVHA